MYITSMDFSKRHDWMSFFGNDAKADLTYKNVHGGFSSSHARRSASKLNPPDSLRFGYGYGHA